MMSRAQHAARAWRIAGKLTVRHLDHTAGRAELRADHPERYVEALEQIHATRTCAALELKALPRWRLWLIETLLFLPVNRGGSR